MIREKIAAAAALGVFSCAAQAIDAVAIEVGYGEDSTRLLRLSLADTWRAPPPGADWKFHGYWEVSAGLWDNPDNTTANVAFTPVFRLQRGGFYVEGGIGMHLVTTHVSAHRVFSTSFQFGEHIGGGLRFGEGGRYDLGVRVQHISNGGLDEPNPGINFAILRFQYYLP
jgi:hypothetical protein